MAQIPTFLDSSSATARSALMRFDCFCKSIITDTARAHDKNSRYSFAKTRTTTTLANQTAAHHWTIDYQLSNGWVVVSLCRYKRTPISGLVTPNEEETFQPGIGCLPGFL